MRRAWIAAWAMGAALACAAVDAPAPADGPDLTGWVVDAQTGKPPLVQAVVDVTWVLRDGPRTRRVMKEVTSVVGGRFYIIDWKQYVDTRGWKLVPGQDPVVRIYAPGYRRVVIKRWDEGERHMLQPLDPSPRAMAAELAAWKRDIDADLAATPAAERQAALREHEKLLLLHDQACRSLPEARPAPCYAADSPAARYIAAAREERSKYLVVEQPSGARQTYRIEAAPDTASRRARTGSPQQSP